MSNTPLLITGLYANPPGADVQLGHGEFFVLENATNAAVSLAGWSVRDAAGTSLALPTNVTLAPRSRRRVYTGRFGASAGDIVLKRRKAFLNNTGETLELIDLGGAVRQRFKYPT